MRTETLSKVTPVKLSHLDWLESEAIHIMREVAGQCSNPVLLFSGGKDSICMLRVAEKAFRPGRFPFPLLHVCLLYTSGQHHQLRILVERFGGDGDLRRTLQRPLGDLGRMSLVQ